MSYARQAVICEPCLLSVRESGEENKCYCCVVSVMLLLRAVILLFGPNFTEENIMML